MNSHDAGVPRSRGLVVLVVVVAAALHLAANITLAQPTPPPTQPSKQQPAKAPDQARESISASLFLFLSGLAAEDHAVVSALLWSDNDPGRLFVDAAASKLLAQYRFGTAMSRRLGVEARQCAQLMGEFGLRPPDPMTMLATQEAYAEGIAGDRTKPVPEGNPLPPLRNVKGIWKIDVTPNNGAGKAADWAAAARRDTAALDRLSNELGAGKYAGISALRDALVAAGFKQLPEDQRPTDD